MGCSAAYRRRRSFGAHSRGELVILLFSASDCHRQDNRPLEHPRFAVINSSGGMMAAVTWPQTLYFQRHHSGIFLVPLRPLQHREDVSRPVIRLGQGMGSPINMWSALILISLACRRNVASSRSTSTRKDSDWEIRSSDSDYVVLHLQHGTPSRKCLSAIFRTHTSLLDWRLSTRLKMTGRRLFKCGFPSVLLPSCYHTKRHI